jgi:hypothetical protein
MYVSPKERVEHKELEPLVRWRDAESAIGVLSQGLPTRPVEFGISVDGRVTVLPWFEFCRHYDLPPQYVVACWN